MKQRMLRVAVLFIAVSLTDFVFVLRALDHPKPGTEMIAVIGVVGGGALLLVTLLWAMTSGVEIIRVTPVLPAPPVKPQLPDPLEDQWGDTGPHGPGPVTVQEPPEEEKPPEPVPDTLGVEGECAWSQCHRQLGGSAYTLEIIPNGQPPGEDGVVEGTVVALYCSRICLQLGKAEHEARAA